MSVNLRFKIPDLEPPGVLIQNTDSYSETSVSKIRCRNLLHDHLHNPGAGTPAASFEKVF